MEPPPRAALDLLDQLIDALNEPLSADERANGWNEEKRERWHSFFLGFRSGLRTASGGYGFGLARELDFHGVRPDSHLAQLVARFEVSLRSPDGA